MINFQRWIMQLKQLFFSVFWSFGDIHIQFIDPISKSALGPPGQSSGL